MNAWKRLTIAMTKKMLYNLIMMHRWIICDCRRAYGGRNG